MGGCCPIASRTASSSNAPIQHDASPRSTAVEQDVLDRRGGVLDRVEALAAVAVAGGARSRVDRDHDDDGRGGRPPLVQRLGKPLARLGGAHHGEAPRLDVARRRGGDGRVEKRPDVRVGHLHSALKCRTLRRLAMTSENSTTPLFGRDPMRVDSIRTR